MTNSSMEMGSTGRSANEMKPETTAEDVSVAREEEAIQAEATPIKKNLEIVPVTGEMPNKEMLRVLLWTAPRSLSTAFERCMTRVPNAKIFNEMYAAAFLLGPDRKVRWHPKLTPKHSYKHCKERMEADHPDHDFVFAKDFALEMHRHTEMLPKGYQHVFLVRHPYKVFTSLRKMLCKSAILKLLSRGARIRDCFSTDGYFYQDMWELYSYLRDHPDYSVPIILDADDIISEPETMIRRYCEVIGLPFHPDMLKWEKAELKDMPWEGPKFFHFMNRLIGCYKNALNSTGFLRGGFRKDPKKDGTKNTSDAKNKSKTPKATNSNNADASDNGQTNNSGDTRDETGKTVEGQSNDAFSADNVPSKDGVEDNKGTAPSSKGATNPSVPEYDLSSLHSDVRNAVNFSMPFYKLLHERRIPLDNYT